jgi:hypothetical protein
LSNTKPAFSKPLLSFFSSSFSSSFGDALVFLPSFPPPPPPASNDDDSDDEELAQRNEETFPHTFLMIAFFFVLALRPFDDVNDDEAVGFAQQTLGKSSFSPLLKTLNLLVEIEALLLKLLIIIDRSKQSDDREEKSVYSSLPKREQQQKEQQKLFFFFYSRM